MSAIKIILIIPNGIKEVNPSGLNSVSEEYALNDDSIFYYQYKLNGTLSFIEEDYEHLRTWEISDKRFTKGTLIFIKYDSEVLRYTFSADTIKWDIDKCVCRLDLDTNVSQISNYNLIKDKEYNAYELVNTRVSWDIRPNNPADPIFFRVENGMYLLDVIEALFNEDTNSTTKVVSEFFGWNASQTYTVGNSDKLTKLIVSSNGDIYKRRFNAANPAPEGASVMKLKLGDIISSLCDMFNLKCRFDNHGIFRIEHITWYKQITTAYADATTGKSAILNGGKLSTYQYDLSGKYATETFDSTILGVWNSNSGSPSYTVTKNDQDFTGFPIVYNTNFNNINSTKKLYSIFNTDVNGQLITDIVDGVFLGAINGSNVLYQLTKLFSPFDYENNLLGWAFLAKDYHLDNKSFPTGTVNGAAASFTVKEYKVQKAIRIDDCNGTSKLIGGTVKTNVGVGKVLATRRKLTDGFIEADLYFDVTTETTIDSPTANYDTYYYDIDTYPTKFDTDAYFEFPLDFNDNPNTGNTVYEEDKMTAIGGRVVIKSSGHFVYYPPADYLGEDFFDYYTIVNGKVGTGTAKIIIYV